MTGGILTLTPNPALDVWTTTREFRKGPKLRCKPPRLDPGGGGINVSRVIHRLNGETRALFAAGGRTGEELAEALDREGVQAQRVPISGVTREVFNVCEEETGGVMRFVTPGPTLRPDDVDALLDLLRRCVVEGSHVVGSGSLPDGAGPDFWARAAEICRDADARFLLDSHDGVEPALEKGLFVFRETGDAVSGLAGENVSWPAGAARWAAERIDRDEAKAVIVTEGAEGALLVTAEHRLVQGPPPGVVEKSAIGAGDSFMGGFSLSLSEGGDWTEALRNGVATAAATLLTPGTELCRKEDVERLVEQCPAPKNLQAVR